MLEVTGLVKAYGAKRALDGLFLTVQEGEVVAIVGPNGAGKSTLFNILAGILKKTSGSCRIDDIGLDQLPLGQLGFLSEEPYFYDSFSPRDTLHFEGTMRGIGLDDMRIDELVSCFALDSYWDLRMDSLSQGMAKRVLLAAALLGQPRLLVLDEPLNGLDIQTVIALKEQLAEKSRQGAHILISSHVLSFVDEVADRVLFIDHGTLIGESDGTKAGAEDLYRQLFL